MHQKLKPKPMKLANQFFLFLFIFLCLGYFREFFFVQMNNILYQKYYNTETTLPVASIMSIFRRYSYSTLYYSKYVFTILWVIIFYLANFFALKKLANVPLTKYLNYSYVFMLVLGAISMAYGSIVNNRLQDDEYTLSRWLMGIAQSPIICLILLASEKLYNKSTTS